MGKPLQTLLIKPAGPDCNMACAYCFYRKKSAFFHESPSHRMAPDLLEEMVRQAMGQAGSHINFIWQGGEPTLMGLEFYRNGVAFQQRFGRGQVVGNGLQTNGLMIDAAWVRFLKSYNWLIGLSLDGPRHVHDHYRRGLDGGGTWETVSASAKRMLDAGLAVNALIVVNDYSVRFPDEIYAFHKNFGLSHMQYIPCVETERDNPSRVLDFSVPAEGYGSFLCRLFDLWLDDFSGSEPTTAIRLFESLLHVYSGSPPPECTLLDTCGTYLVVEHNGDVFSCDFFVEPAWRLGNMRDSKLSAMLHAERQCAFGQRKANLTEECTSCRWLPLCRGGCPKDRLPGGAGTPPNFLCAAYRMFFAYADERFRGLAARWKKRPLTAALQASGQREGRPVDGKVGRNQPCPCGSGKKYKRCCGA